MKKILLVAGVVVFIMSLAGGAFAATSVLTNNNIGVSGSVQAKCKESSAAVFPTLQIDPTPLTTSTIAASTDEVVACTKNQTYTIMISDASLAATACNNDSTGVYGLKLKAAGATDITYTFKCSGAGVSNVGTFAGQGFGTDIPMGLSVSVAAADASTASFGANYQDTVTLTVQY